MDADSDTCPLLQVTMAQRAGEPKVGIGDLRIAVVRCNDGHWRFRVNADVEVRLVLNVRDSGQGSIQVLLCLSIGNLANIGR